jgi:hypothetical protein
VSLGLRSGHELDLRCRAFEDGPFLQTDLGDFIETGRISSEGGNGDDK